MSACKGSALKPTRWSSRISPSGNGSFEKDSPIEIVAMEKEQKIRFVHHHRVGKRQRHAHKAGEALAQRIFPAFDMSSLSRLFPQCGVLLARDHRHVGYPEIREAIPCAVGGWDGFPQPLARLFTPITHCIRDHVSRFAEQGDPSPGVVRFLSTNNRSSSSSRVVEAGSSESVASRVVHKGGSCAPFFDPTRCGCARDPKGAGFS
jgi:hypothetical protein